jgi:ribonuclease P protein component
MKDESFPPSARLKSSREFSRVFQQGVVVADDTLVLHAIPFPIDGASKHSVSASNAEQPSNRSGSPSVQGKPLARLGLSISKRAGNAPLRNRWKRLIREAFRKQRGQLPICDYVVRPKKDAVPDYERIFHSLPILAKRAAKKIQKR